MQAFYLPGVAGRLFALYRPPAPGRTHAGDVLFVPPFAEEMNRSRRMATLLAHALAEVGFGTLVVDLFGTGDSDGEFRDARLGAWRDDLIRAHDWLSARGTPGVGVVALRFGALLATELAAARPVTKLVLWQPAASGEQLLTQLLRIRLASALATGGGETTSALRARLSAGETIEVAGYDIAPALAADIDTLRLDPDTPPNVRSLHWFDVAPEDDRPISPASTRMIERWRARGAAVDARTIKGEAFWTLLETTVAPRLIGATAAAFA